MKIPYITKHRSGVVNVRRKAPAWLRFWRDTDKNGPVYHNLGQCWVWKRGALSRKCPYGQISVKHRMVRVHKFSWEIHNGPVPAGLSVLHKCDTPLCVNPHHLFVGTQKDNQEDMVAKGRESRGESRPASKLTEGQVKDIRQRYRKIAKGHGNGAALAREYGVSKQTILSIISGKTWRYLL